MLEEMMKQMLYVFPNKNENYLLYFFQVMDEVAEKNEIEVKSQSEVEVEVEELQKDYDENVPAAEKPANMKVSKTSVFFKM